MLEALCRQSSTTLDIVHAEDGPPITQRTSGLGSGPNWEVLAFRPELPPIARNEAMKAVDVLRGTYALAP